MEDFGLEISLPKTQYIISSRSTKIIQGSRFITLGDQMLESEDEIKCLGINLDGKLHQNSYVRYLTTKTSRVLNIVRVLLGVTRGPSSSCLLMVTNSLVGGCLRLGAPYFLRASRVHPRHWTGLCSKRLEFHWVC